MQENTKIDKNWTSLKRESSNHIDRTTLLVDIIIAIKHDMKIFDENSFSFFQSQYEEINYIKDKAFTVTIGNSSLENCRYIGLSDTGEIIVEKNNQQLLFSSGEISILANSIKSK